MWSEHCSYKSSKKYLNGFPTKAPWVIQGPGENAGVIDIGDGMAAVFKMESHNHPSFIEPYQSAATGVGGILRDVFTMGAIGESRSKETGNHVKRVAEYSKLLALAYGMSKEEAELLKQASPMHDIGKIAIPDNILKKPIKNE